MNKVIRIDNPLALTEQDIIQYLRLEAAAGKAGYEHILAPSSLDAMERLADANAALLTHKRDLEQRTTNLIFDEILPSGLIEETGYVLWKERIRNSRYPWPNVLVGTIVERLKLRTTGEEGFVVSTETPKLEGLDVFDNYTSREPTTTVFNNVTSKFYIIRDAAIRTLLGKNPSEDIKFQQFY
ncbi:hypothetical protein KY359_05110, partial [Candidatus Woesearchaeota archaeon]|nr:hypothetical protein [Candidatus Woesearchaeota archaeon]